MTQKRYTEKRLMLWKEGTWVTCPQCQNVAVITHNNGTQVRCEHCGFEKKKVDLMLFTAIVKLNCPNCGTPIHQRQGGLKETEDFRQVKCPQCGEEYTVKPQYETYYKSDASQHNGLKCDSDFGLPYFFQENIRGNLFWARNLLHLQVMEDYIAADLRERNGMTMVAKLPTFIKIKKNREQLLKILRRWKEKISQPDAIQLPQIAKNQICLFFSNKDVHIKDYLRDSSYQMMSSIHFTQIYYHKNGYQWICFSKYNRLKRTFAKEWLAQIPFEVKNLYLYQYDAPLDKAQNILNHFLKNYLEEHTADSLYLSIGETLYPAENFPMEWVSALKNND